MRYVCVVHDVLVFLLWYARMMHGWWGVVVRVLRMWVFALCVVSKRVRMPRFELGISQPQCEVLTTILHAPGEAGYRSQYLAHAKRALYHLSYIPIQNTHTLQTHTNASHSTNTTHAPPRNDTHYTPGLPALLRPIKPPQRSQTFQKRTKQHFLSRRHTCTWPSITVVFVGFSELANGTLATLNHYTSNCSLISTKYRRTDDLCMSERECGAASTSQCRTFYTLYFYS